MPITLAQSEATLVGPHPNAGAGLVGLGLSAAGFDATGASPVAALAPAITQALLACGITPVDFVTPADVDTAQLTAATWPMFLDIASMLLLEQAAMGFASKVKSIKWEDYSKELFGPAAMTSRRDDVRRRWGYGAARITVGSIDLGFQQKDPTQNIPLWPYG
jgi:hypothetical protein